jgi:[acyl-carrier-protein] S-malonyltransferase
MSEPVAATVVAEVVTVADVDARERAIRAGRSEHALPRPGTSEARQFRRWLTQVLVAERVVAAEADARHLDVASAPAESDVLPDTVTRMEVGSVAAATLAEPRGRAVFVDVTADVRVADDAVDGYHARNPDRFATRTLIAAHLLAAARRREYRRWLDARCADLVTLAPGYEHPGDPRQPDNTHRH